MRHMKEYPSQEYLLKYFYYKDGVLYNKISRGKAKKDNISSFSHSNGRVYIKFKGGHYFLHKIIWILEKGNIPKNYTIDHINRNIKDNNLENLRIVTCQDNCRNQKLHKNNTSGICGVSKYKDKWKAYIYVDYKQKYLGLFDTIEEAKIIRNKANKKFNFHKNHGKLNMG